MQTQTYAVSNDKGGTGKTTVAYHLAAAAAMEGETVAIIDVDPQGSLSGQVGLVNTPGVYDVIVRGVEPSERLFLIPPEYYTPRPSEAGRLFLLPGNHETRMITASDMYSRLIIRDLLEDLAELNIKVVVIDTSPSPSELHNAVYTAANAMVIPTHCEPMGLLGLHNTLAHVENANKRFRDASDPLRIAGVLPNLHRTRTGVHQDILKEMEELLEEKHITLFAPNEMRIVWSEASAAGKTVYAHAPQTEAAKDMLELARKVLHPEVAYGQS